VNQTLAAEILVLARARKLRIAVAESCTGGMVAAALTDVPGASDVFECGFVTYSNAAKMRLLGVTAQHLASFGAVSEPVARQMARGALAESDADIAVALTGIAGPGGSGSKPAGRVWFALAHSGREPHTLKREFGEIGRDNVRRASVEQALQLLKTARGPT